MSQVQSFGSHCHPHSQSRKMSIGVVVEPSAGRRLMSAKGRDIASPTAAAANCHRNDSTKGAQVSPKKKQIEPLEQGSPWITTRSKHEKSTTAGTASHAEVIGTKTNTGGVRDDQNRFTGGSEGLVYRRKGEKSANTQIGEKLPSMTTEEQEPLTSNVGDKDEYTVNRKSEALRMKLWELLGTVSSPSKEKLNPLLQVDGDSFQPEGGKQPATGAVKPRQDSDTIETDSESPDSADKRPVTRSLTRKRAPSKLKRDKVKRGPPSASRQKQDEKNVFSFEEGWYAGSKDATNLNPLICNKRKRTGRKGTQIEPCKTSVQQKKHDEKIQQLMDKKQNPLAAYKSSSGGSGKEHSRHAQPHAKENNIDPKRSMAREDSPKQRTSKPGRLADISSSALPDYGNLQEHIIQSSLKNAANPQLNPESLHTEHMSSEEAIFSFGKFTSKLFSNRNGRDKLQDTPPGCPVPPVQENDAGNTSSEDTCSEKSEEGPGAEALSPEISTAEKPRFMLHRTKRLCSLEGVLHQGCIPAPVSPKVSRENISRREPEEQNVGEEEEEVEDGMTRAIAMLALALEKLKSKVKLLTRQKSSEILVSVAVRIQAQLHIVESQIQTDTCKLTSLSKQKRKQLEKEFQEQEERLNTIYGNFKKEIGRLLEGCKGMIEGLQGNHTELKGIIEKQKASHQKLIIQVEEAVETQLHDAEKRITAINQSAREQMLQLKLVIAECLEGGLLF